MPTACVWPARHRSEMAFQLMSGMSHRARASSVALVTMAAMALLPALPSAGMVASVDPVTLGATTSGPTAPATPFAALERAGASLQALLERAHHGELSQSALRIARRAVEARLELELAGMATDLRPGEMERLGDARAKLNQIIIRCQEWEFFGPNDRPEWGWYPSRQIRSVGVAADR